MTDYRLSVDTIKVPALDALKAEVAALRAELAEVRERLAAVEARLDTLKEWLNTPMVNAEDAIGKALWEAAERRE